MDEVNVDEFLKEASNAIDDPEKLFQYIREKATIAIERFLVSKTTARYCKCIYGVSLKLSFIFGTELPTKDVYPSRET